MTATTTAIPAEIVREGRAVQRINVYFGGTFERQIRYVGTETEARAYAQSLATHR
jgi:hypothetical protein